MVYKNTFIFRKCLNIIRIILMPIIMIPLLLLGYKSITLAILTTIVNAICLITNMLYCLKNLNIKLKFNGFDFKLLKEIFAYSFFIFLNSIIDKINWSVDNFILGTVSGTVAVAVYAVAAQFNTMYLSFSTAISGVLLPKVAKMEAQNSSDKQFTNIFIKTGRIQYIIMALIITGFVLFGKFFILTLFGKEYEQAYYMACILMIPVTVPLIQNVGLNIIQAKNKYKFRTIVFFFIAILNIMLSIPLAKKYGGIGTSTGTAIALIVGQIIIMNIYYYKKINIDIIAFWKNIFRMTIPVAITFIIGIGINNFIKNYSIIVFAFKIVLYVIIYMLLMWYLGMKEEERESFLQAFSEELSGERKGSLAAFCVMGGIFGEGIDLKNEQLIGAIVVGTGLPQISNEREILMGYFEKRLGAGFDYAYRYPGMNKVLQAAGRVIRTVEDVGVIELLDERFLQSEYRALFPREWERQTVCRIDTVEKYLEEFWNRS